MYIVAVLHVVLTVMCISMIYKFLSLGLWSTARSRQAKWRTAKPSHWRGKLSKAFYGHVVDICDSVYFLLWDRGNKDSFAAVLTMLSRSSMYKLSVANPQKITLMCDEYSYLYKWLTLFIYPQVKINQKPCLGISVCSWGRHSREQDSLIKNL